MRTTGVRYFPPPQPKHEFELSRPQVAGRVHALRSALDTLQAQSDADGGAVFTCLGAMKKSLIHLEERLRELDRAFIQPGPAAALGVAAETRLRQAQTEVAEVVPGIGADALPPARPAVPYSPTEKQVEFYRRLAESPVFTAEERRRALEWITTRATRQTIKDQIEWLKQQVQTRRTTGK